MTRALAAATAALALLAVASPPAAQAQPTCSAFTIADMRARQVPAWEIRRLCGEAPAPTATPRASNRCVTPSGSCTLPSPGAAGAPCACALGGEQVSGQVQ